MWRKSARRDFSQRLLPRGHAEVSDTDQCELSHFRKSSRAFCKVGFAPMNGIGQRDLSGPKRADIVAKVENRTTLKISRKLMFRRFYRCNAR
jgi:hypothetical protein